MANKSALPELAVAKVRGFCAARSRRTFATSFAGEVETRGRAIMIYEHRPPWRPDYEPEWTKREIAQFRYDPETLTWSLYWADRNGRWLKGPDAPSAGDVEPLLRVGKRTGPGRSTDQPFVMAIPQSKAVAAPEIGCFGGREVSECHEEGPPRLDSWAVLAAKAKGGPVPCCTRGWT